MIFMKGSAHAAVIDNCSPNIPTDICADVYTTGTTNRLAQYVWISLPNQPRTQNAQISYGTNALAVQYNITGGLTAAGLNTSGNAKIKDKIQTLNYTTSPSAYVRNAAGVNVANLSVTGLSSNFLYGYNYSYRFIPNPAGFINGAFSVNGIPANLSQGSYYLVVTVPFQQIHKTASEYQCVNPTKGPLTFPLAQGTMENLVKFCERTDAQRIFSFVVLPPPNQPAVPTLTVDCSSITAKALDADIAGGATSWRLIEGGRIIRSGSGGPSTFKTKDLFPQDGLTRNLYLSYDDKNSSGAIVSTSQIGPRPLSCKGFDFTPKAQVQLFNNDQIDAESPNKAKFSNMGILSGSFSGTVKGVKVTRTYTVTRGSITAPNPASITSDISIASGYDFGNEERPVSGLFPGDKVCVVVTVDKGSGVIDGSGNVVINDGPKSNLPECDTVINKPYVSFYGGDVNTCGGIKTFYNLAGSFGSGVQYAAQAFGGIDQFSSARGTGIGSGPKVLSFANNDPGNLYGGLFGDGGCTTQRDYFAGKPTSTTPNPGSIGVPGLPAGKVLYSGNVTLTGGKMQTGRRTALYVDGDLNISGNIEYAGVDWLSLSDIPSLHIFVKGNIYIQPGVSTLTGFYVAQKDDSGNKGIIDTCASGSANGFASYTNLSEIWSNCNSTLSVRGAFASDQTLFHRGSNSLRDANTPNENVRYTSSKAAERFYLGPEMYLVGPDTTSTGGSGGSGGYQYEAVLPPLL